MRAAPSLFGSISDVLAILVLLTEFAMFRTQLVRPQIGLYALQSLFVAGLALAVAVTQGTSELYGVALFTLLLKVGVIPYVLRRLLARVGDSLEGHHSVPVTRAALFAIGVTAFGFFALDRIPLHGGILPRAALSISAAVVLVAFLLMIVREDVVSQGIAFFTLENGVTVAGLVVAWGMPLILELAVLFDLLVAVVVFAVVIRTLHGRTRSLNAHVMDSLRG